MTEKKTFSSIIKDLYHNKGIKSNGQVYDELVKLGMVDEGNEAETKKVKRKIASLMWSIRKPEDKDKVKRTTNKRVDYLRHLVAGGFDNAMCHKVMENMAETMGFEAPDKIWVNNTAWRLRKELGIDKQGRKVDKEPDTNDDGKKEKKDNTVKA